MRIGVLWCCFFFFSSVAATAQSSSETASVQMYASVQTDPPSITLHFLSHPNTNSFSVYRRSPESSVWGDVYATVADGSATTYTDTGVTIGEEYEYKVVRSSASGTGYGYLQSGMMVPGVGYRGAVLLLIEEGLVSPLDAEIEQLEKDLVRDGWAVVLLTAKTTDSPGDVRMGIATAYGENPDLKAIYILGNVPVPYSGNLGPDGHGEHFGAWAADGFYGDIDGTWTDASTSATGGGYAWNYNSPGDGRFDHNRFPSEIELQVGRVDFSDMPSFTASEVELTRSYLQKAHDYKTKNWTPTSRGIVFDNLEWVGYPVAASGYMSLGALVGTDNVSAPNGEGAAFSTYVDGKSYLWTFHAGGGQQSPHPMGGVKFTGTNNGTSTQELAAMNMGGVFNMSFGSYFGDWDNTDNFLRAMLGSGDALTNVWAGVPNWFFHHMGMGHPIGYSVLRTMNNTNSNYSLQNGGWQGQDTDNIHLALMGDPTLRLSQLAPPEALSITSKNGSVEFAWSASADSVEGYHLFHIDPVTGVQTQLTSEVVSDTELESDAIAEIKGHQYMVRAVKLEITASGSFYNFSLGAVGTAEETIIPPGCEDDGTCPPSADSAGCCMGTGPFPMTLGGFVLLLFYRRRRIVR